MPFSSALQCGCACHTSAPGDVTSREGARRGNDVAAALKLSPWALRLCGDPWQSQAAWGTVCWTQRHAGHGSAWVCVKVGGRGVSGPRSHLLLPAAVRQRGMQRLHARFDCHNFKSLFYAWPQPYCRLSQPEQWLKKIVQPQLCLAKPRAPRRAALCQPCVQLPGLSGNHVSDYMGNETRALFVCGSD